MGPASRPQVAAVDGGADARMVRVTRRVWALLGGTSLLLLVLAWPRTSLWLLPRLLVLALLVVGVRVAVRAARGRAPWPGRDGWRARTGLLAAGAVAGAVLVALTVVVHLGSQPEVDDFYAVGTGEPGEPDVPGEAGRLVREEPLTAGVPEGFQARRILYTTVDAAGEAALGSATVVAPAELPAEPPDVLAVGHGTTGVATPCAPSLSSRPFSGATAALAEVVDAGTVAVTADYVGLGTDGPHAYLDGPAAGANVLDAVRAAHELLALSDRVVLWGHSQGGQAALWAGAMAPSYAPELELLGVAAFAPATDLPAITAAVNETLEGRLVQAYLVRSWDEVHPDLGLRDDEGWLERRLVDRIASRCLTGRDALAAGAVATQLFGPVLTDEQVAAEPLAGLLEANTLTDPVAAPVVVAQGADDTLVPADLQRAWVESRCAAGQSLTYVEYDGRDHGSLVADDSPLTDDLVSWTRARLAGEAVSDPTC